MVSRVLHELQPGDLSKTLYCGATLLMLVHEHRLCPDRLSIPERIVSYA